MKTETILLTGATGFIGSHLLEAMIAAGYRVVVLKRSGSDTRRICGLLSLVSSYDWDREGVSMAFGENDIEMVVHTAVDYGNETVPLSDLIEANVAFPIRLLESAEDHGAQLFVNMDTMLPPTLSRYALSKQQLADWLRVHVGQVRLMNLKIELVYGPSQQPHHFIGRLIRQICNSVGDIPLTAGTQRRDFIHVSDVVRAVTLLIRKRNELPLFSEFQIGTGTAMPVRDIVLKIKEEFERKRERAVDSTLVFGALPLRKDEPMELSADISGLLRLGWAPVVGVSEGIREMVADYLDGP